MTPDEFGSTFVDLYRRARKLSVPCQNITRARARSVSSDLEELVAAYICANSKNSLHIYVDQPVSIGDGKVAYPDLVILDLDSKTVISIVDVKTDIGWKRDGMQSMCEKLDRISLAIKTQGTVTLGAEPKSRVPYAVSADLTCHLVIGALKNSGNNLQTPDAIKFAKERKVQVHVLIEGKHPNDFSRQRGAHFPGMKVCSQNLAALVSGASAVTPVI